MSEKIYVFSQQQYEKNKELSEKLSKKYICPTIIVDGVEKRYTDIVSDINNIKFTDSKIIFKGNPKRR